MKKNHKVNEEEFLEDRRQRARQLNREINGLIVVKKEGFIKRMIKSIKKFFGFNKNRLYIPDEITLRINKGEKWEKIRKRI